jgi:hypothetical protein
MGMWTTPNQDTLSDVLKAFSGAAYERFHHSHAYEAGYLQSVLIHYIQHLPKRVQKQLIEDMVDAAQKQERALLERRAAGENGFFVERVQRPCD